jgi:DNA-binding GntR family transcriptional regulator
VPDRSRVIAYRTLAHALRSEIRNGKYAGGRKLPTEEQLSAAYSVSRQTVRRAMQDLVSEGIIYRVAGRGTYPVAGRTGTSASSARSTS